MTDTQYQHHSTKKRRRQVCLFGLSADPPTGEGGHLGIVTHLSSTMDLFDEVRVLPVYRHMFSVSFIVCKGIVNSGFVVCIYLESHDCLLLNK